MPVTVSPEQDRNRAKEPAGHDVLLAPLDVDAGRLAMVARMAERLSDELDAGLSFSQTLDREEALRGADFVINTAQVGGHAWTEAQRELAERHGYYRGVRLHNFGQAAFHLEVARDVERLCPDAWLIQSANPVFEACTLMHRETSVKVLGLCHGHYGYKEIAHVLGLELEHVSAQMPGFNHWIWMTDFRYKGQDAYPLLDAWIETEAEAYWANDDRGFGANQMRRAAIHQYQLYGLMPIGDTPRMVGWWYHTDLPTKQRWFGPLGGFDSEIGWGQYLEHIDERVQRVQEAALDEETPISATFKPVQSNEQIVPIIDSLVNDVERTFQVNIPNRGPILPGLSRGPGDRVPGRGQRGGHPRGERAAAAAQADGRGDDPAVAHGRVDGRGPAHRRPRPAAALSAQRPPHAQPGAGRGAAGRVAGRRAERADRAGSLTSSVRSTLGRTQSPRQP